MKCGNIVLSDSLWALLCANVAQSPCVRLIYLLLNENRFRLLNPNLPGNYFTFREAQGLISYCPRGRIQQFSLDGKWVRAGRTGMKPGRWIKSMLHPRLANRLGDEIYAQFATIVKHEELKGLLTFNVVPVGEIYKLGNFYPPIDSCMWNKPVAPFYRAFGASGVVAVNGEGTWVGRAVLWENVRLVPGRKKITFMDRIYATSEEVTLGMIKHAQSQGWYCKSCQNNSPSTPVLHPDGCRSSSQLQVERDEDLDNIEFYPYLDTFRYGDDSSLNNYEPALYCYEETGGGRGDGHDGEVQTIDGMWIDQDNAACVQGIYYVETDRRIVRDIHSDEWVLKTDTYRIDLRNVSLEDLITHREHQGEDCYVYIHRNYVRNG